MKEKASQYKATEKFSTMAVKIAKAYNLQYDGISVKNDGQTRHILQSPNMLVWASDFDIYFIHSYIVPDQEREDRYTSKQERAKMGFIPLRQASVFLMGSISANLEEFS